MDFLYVFFSVAPGNMNPAVCCIPPGLDSITSDHFEKSTRPEFVIFLGDGVLTIVI